jgi:hypothetical protein
VLGGLAAGVGFAGVTGVAAAAGSGSSSGAHSSSRVPAHPARGLPGKGWPGPAGVGRPGRGGEGTITSLSTDGSGYELTVRTLQGTETVLTTNSTRVTGPDLRPTSLSSSDIGRVVRIMSRPPAPPTSSSASSSNVIDATRIRLIDPRVIGRVLKVGNDGFTLVGRNGQKITVTGGDSVTPQRW